MLNRRLFLGALSYPMAASAFRWPEAVLNGSASALDAIWGYSKGPEDASHDEDFWFQVAQAFTIDRSVINLNNGGVSPSPAVVQEAMKKHLDFSNQTPPPVSLWRILEPQKE